VNVIHVITGLQVGGAEVALCRLLDSLTADGHKATVIALRGAGLMTQRLRARGLRVIHLGVRPTVPSPLALLQLRRLVRAARPDVVHAWMYHANVAASIADVRAEVPVLWGVRQTIYDLSHEKSLTRAVIHLGGLLSARPRRIVYNSTTSARQHEALGYRRTKTRIIPNGFDTEEFEPNEAARGKRSDTLGLPEDAFVIGHVARWHPMKDHETFLKAAALFAAREPRAMFAMVGNGVDTANAQLVERVGSLGLSERARLCGLRRDMPAIYAGIDVLALSSSWGEAFPNVIGEAMACAVPCAATAIGDVPEIIGDTGFVVPPRDPEALCAAWTRLAVLCPEERRALGQRARARIMERYSLSDIARQYGDLYAEVVASRGRR
jgi:glycosyltransferase involved in cell wall biosynthesis